MFGKTGGSSNISQKRKSLDVLFSNFIEFLGYGLVFSVGLFLLLAGVFDIFQFISGGYIPNIIIYYIINSLILCTVGSSLILFTFHQTLVKAFN